MLEEVSLSKADNIERVEESSPPRGNTSRPIRGMDTAGQQAQNLNFFESLSSVGIEVMYRVFQTFDKNGATASASKVATYSGISCFVSSDSNNAWIINSGATNI